MGPACIVWLYNASLGGFSELHVQEVLLEEGSGSQQMSPELKEIHTTCILKCHKSLTAPCFQRINRHVDVVAS